MSKNLLIGLGIGALVLIILVVAVVLILKKIDYDEKHLVLQYKISSGIPFKWEYEIEDESIVVLEKTHKLKNKIKKNVSGGPVYTNYIFKGLKEGTTKITFKFVSITGENSDNFTKEEHIVKVDKDLKIKLVINQ